MGEADFYYFTLKQNRHGGVSAQSLFWRSGVIPRERPLSPEKETVNHKVSRWTTSSLAISSSSVMVNASFPVPWWFQTTLYRTESTTASVHSLTLIFNSYSRAVKLNAISTSGLHSQTSLIFALTFV